MPASRSTGVRGRRSENYNARTAHYYASHCCCWWDVKKEQKSMTGGFQGTAKHINSMLIDFFMQECLRLSDQINFNVYSYYNKQLPAKILFATIKAECIIFISMHFKR
jgi:hypothetical protein